MHRRQATSVYPQPTHDEMARLDSVLLGLAQCKRVAGFRDAPNASVAKLPEQLATSGEARARLRHYFARGVDELREVLDEALRSVEAARAVVARINTDALTDQPREAIHGAIGTRRRYPIRSQRDGSRATAPVRR